MSEEAEIKSGEESESEEANSLGQDDISSLIDEMQNEKNPAESKDEDEKSIGDETKQDPDEIKDDKNEDMESNDLNQDDISKLIDEVQTKVKSSEADEKEDITENVEHDHEGEKSTESEKLEAETTQPIESIDDNAKEGDAEEQTETQERDENPDEKVEKTVKEDNKSEKEADEKDEKKENDEENNDSFKGLDSDDEIEIDGESDPESDVGSESETDAETDAQKEAIDKENNDKQSKQDEEEKENEKDVGSGQAVKLIEVKKRSKGKRFKLFIISIVSVACIAILLGLFTFFKKPETDINKSAKPSQPEQTAKPESKYSEDQQAQNKKETETKDIILSDSIIAKLNDITELKDELLIKEREIADLIKNYKDGISEMEDEILRVKQNNQIDSFNVAIQNKKIEFGMMTIQRRLAYIEKISPPYSWLNQGIEELLYLKRKIKIDSRVSRVISGIDMDKMIQEIDIVTQSYRTGMENLKIDMQNIELAPFELIWEKIIDKERFSEANTQKDNESVGIKKTAFSTEGNNNQVIWEEICTGNFKRKNEMTALSTGGAKCLSKWKHADLFINGLSELSPKVAKYLLKWEGNWICLNGVKELSPEAAKYLFQWQGNWISLNGLSQISSEILKHLPQWQGKQLELMGLKYKKTKSEQVGLKSLVKWEKSGGKLYIPAQIRQVIKNF